MNKPMPSSLQPGNPAPDALSVSKLTGQIKPLLKQPNKLNKSTY